MNNDFSPLSGKELDWLDRFLLDRITEGTDTDGMDEGVLDISELDDLFTAIVSGPLPLSISDWLPATWGGFEPEWKNDKAFEDVISLMLRHMNGIAATLMEQPDGFEPIYLESKHKGKQHLIVDEWCEGYLRGMALYLEDWNLGARKLKNC